MGSHQSIPVVWGAIGSFPTASSDQTYLLTHFATASSTVVTL